MTNLNEERQDEVVLEYENFAEIIDHSSIQELQEMFNAESIRITFSVISLDEPVSAHPSGWVEFDND